MDSVQGLVIVNIDEMKVLVVCRVKDWYGRTGRSHKSLKLALVGTGVTLVDTSRGEKGGLNSRVRKNKGEGKRRSILRNWIIELI